MTEDQAGLRRAKVDCASVVVPLKLLQKNRCRQSFCAHFMYLKLFLTQRSEIFILRIARTFEDDTTISKDARSLPKTPEDIPNNSEVLNTPYGPSEIRKLGGKYHHVLHF